MRGIKRIKAMKEFKDQVTVTVKDSAYNLTSYAELNKRLEELIDNAADIVSKYAVENVEIDENTDFLRVTKLEKEDELNDYYDEIEKVFHKLFNVIANYIYQSKTKKSFEELNEYISYEKSSFADDFNVLEYDPCSLFEIYSYADLATENE